MSDLTTMFLSSFLIWLGLFSLASGAFTAYYGTGRSRSIGASLIIVGLVFLLLVVWFIGWLPMTRPLVWDSGLVINTFIATLGALLGGVVAVVLFLGAIMRS